MALAPKKAVVYDTPDLAMMFRVYMGPLGPGLITLQALRSLTAATLTALGARLDALDPRVKTLEDKAPTVTSGSAVPGILTLGTKTVVMDATGVKKGDILLATPRTDLPGGLSIAWARSNADGKVSLCLSAVLAITSNTAITFDILAWRKGT